MKHFLESLDILYIYSDIYLKAFNNVLSDDKLYSYRYQTHLEMTYI